MPRVGHHQTAKGRSRVKKKKSTLKERAIENMCSNGWGPLLINRK